MAKKTNPAAERVEAALQIFETTARKFRSGRHDENNQEVIDPRPMAAAVKYQRPPTLHEQLETFLRSAELRKLASNAGVETFDEANDFEMDDIQDPLDRFFSTPTPWEEGTPGQFEADAQTIRTRVDELVTQARAAKEKHELDQKELETLRKKTTKAGKPAASAPIDDED